LTKEQKINLIRYGPDAITNKTKKIAINLLAKYKPMINLQEYKIMAKKLDTEARVTEKLINFEKENEIDEHLTADEQAQIKKEYVKNSMKSYKGKTMSRRNLTLNKNGDRENVSRNVISSGYGQ
jgi:hypothetical protein